MATDYQVTPEEVSSAQASVTNSAGEIQSQLDSLRTYIYNLEAVWGGVAHDTFNVLMSEYDIYAKMLHDALVDIASGLGGTYVNYSASEEANLRSLQSLQQELPAPNL
jgi:WXG100 family type VII secretion target